MDAATRNARVVAVSGACLGAAASCLTPFVSMRPNRIVDGMSATGPEALGGWAWVLLACWAAVAVLALAPGRMPRTVRGVALAVAGGVAAPLALWRVGVVAAAYAAERGEVARLSFGAGVWLTLLASYVCVFAALALLPHGAARVAAAYLPIAAVIGLIVTGGLDATSIMREFRINETEFWSQARLQLGYTAGATGAGIAVGFPLGLLAARRPATEPAVFGVLNVLQVLPVLAFIGLLNPVLTGASDAVPALAALGVRGVGWAPVVLVLTSYAVYPIARNTHAALTTLDPGIMDAAAGVGMGRWRRLAEVELPAALPVIVAGVRIAAVQATAGAIIAGLVGGGGLGIFVFLGAAQTAVDLVLLGAVPIALMALTLDRIALLVESRLLRWSVLT